MSEAQIQLCYRIHCTDVPPKRMSISPRLHPAVSRITTEAYHESPPQLYHKKCCLVQHYVTGDTKTHGRDHPVALCIATVRRRLAGRIAGRSGATLVIYRALRAVRQAHPEDGGRRFIRNFDRLHGVTPQQIERLLFIAVLTGNRKGK